MRQAIYTILSAISSHIYPLVAPQGETSDYAVFFLDREQVLVQTGVYQNVVTLTLDFYGDDFSTLVTFMGQVETALNGTSGTYSTKTVSIINLVRETDQGWFGELEKYHFQQVYTIKFD